VRRLTGDLQSLNKVMNKCKAEENTHGIYSPLVSITQWKLSVVVSAELRYGSNLFKLHGECAEIII